MSDSETGSPVPPAGGAAPEEDAPQPTRTHVDPLRKLLTGSLLAGRYRIREILGVGGMGMVYRAHDEELDMEVAVKVLRPEYADQTNLIDRFRRELVLGRQVSHSNVVRIHDIGRDEDLLFLTMDLVEGRSLRKVLEKEGPLPEARAVEITRQLAEALAVAHRESVVHRDLKPSNIMIDDAGRVYITDFGVARSLSQPGLTRTGAVVGTPDYLSPEQAKGEEIDGRSDLYSLGLMLYEMLTGRLPFPGGSLTESLAQRISGRAQDPSQFGFQLSRGVREVLRRCLERVPSRRYQEAAELVADLDDLAGAGSGRRRLRAAIGAAAALALLAAGWGVVRWINRPVPAESETAATSDRPAAAARSVALLPFVDETGRPELGWLASAVPEMTTESLAESPLLQVVDHSRILATLDQLKLDPSAAGDATLRQVAELFDADRLVTGKIRSLGDRLRADARLVSVVASGEISTEPFTAEAVEPAALVAELDAALRRLLAVRPAVSEPLEAASPEALEAYGEGVRRLDRGDAMAAVPELERAVELDRDFAPAWLRLAEAYHELGIPDRAYDASERAVAAFGSGDSRLALLARARLAAAEGESERAVEILERLVERYPNDLEGAVALAEARGDRGELQSAIDTLAGVVAGAPNHPRAWYLMAKFSILDGDSQTAVDDYLVRAMVIQNRTKSDQGRADVLNAFGAAYSELGQLERAIENYESAAELRRTIGDLQGYATTLRNLAQVHTVRGGYDAAETNLETALGILDEVGDASGRADLINALGFLQETRGRNREALERYREALAIRREGGDRLAEAESLNNVGFAYFQLGETDNASVYWRQALDLYRETGNLGGEALVLQSLGQLQLARGEWDSAVRTYLEALELARQIDFPQATAVSLGFLGRMARLQGRYAAALASADEALELLARLEDPRGQAEFALDKAAALAEMGRPEEAAKVLDAAEPWIEAGGSDEQRAIWLLLRANLDRSEGDRSAARERLDEARAVATASESEAPPVAVEIESGRQRLAAGDAAGAVEILSRAVAAADRAGDFALRLEARTVLARSELQAAGPAEALVTLDRAERLRRDAGLWAGGWRLADLRSRALDALGRAEEAAQAAETATAEKSRLLEGLDGEARAALEATFAAAADER